MAVTDMKTLKPLFCAFLVILSMGFLKSATFAQKNVLPPELNQTSSLSEILAWLDKNSFPQARIGLDLWKYSSSPSRVAGRWVHESAVFSKGFKLIKADGCYLTLGNDDIKILSFGTTAYGYERQSLASFRKEATDLTPYPAELYIRLNRMSYKKGKKPYLHTKNPDEAKLLGSWRTEFKEKGGRDVLLIVVFDSPPGVGRDQMYGDSVTFTFDSKDMSEQFYAAFRQAIRLCAAK